MSKSAARKHKLPPAACRFLVLLCGGVLVRQMALAGDVAFVPPPPSATRPTETSTSPTGASMGPSLTGDASLISQPIPVGSSAPISQSSVAPEGQVVDLASALRLAGVQNLSLVVAQQRVEYAVAVQQFAAAQILPSLNLGGNYDNHTGVLQQDPGNIISVNRSAIYVGAGADAVGSGTVEIPGLVYNLNVSEAIFGYLVTRQGTRQARFERAAADNTVLRDVGLAYTDLLRTAGLRSLAVLARNDTGEVARLTADYAKTGAGRQADADRAATEFARRDEEVLEALAAEAQASHALCELLNLDPLIRLVPLQSQVVPQPVVPTQMPLAELLAVAALNRPELLARRAAIRAAMLELDGARVLPFSPTVLMGLSGGAFGGGSDIAVSQGLPRFGEISDRTDLDVALYWSLRNLGVGNKALIDAARSRLRTSQFHELDVLDTVREEVVAAYVQALSWLAQVKWQAQAVRSGEQASKEDLIRVRGHEARPIELLDSLRQVIEARRDYLNAIIGYNRAELRLYVALGNPPADILARPVPAELLRPPEQTLDVGIRNSTR
jgi:outer membrane protein TolC